MDIECTYKEFKGDFATINGNESLTFTTSELFHAAYTVGKQNWNEVNNPTHFYYSERKKDFRISMIQAFLNMNSDNIGRSPIFKNLDPSEKGAINYFFGIVFCNLVMHKKFSVRWLMHLDLFDGVISYQYEGSRRRPDFVARLEDRTWIAVEAKGRQLRDNDAVQRAQEQLENLATIDGENLTLKITTMFYGGEEDLKMEIIDPQQKGKLHLKIDQINYDYARDYYAMIFLLIKQDMQEQRIEDRTYAMRFIFCHNIYLGLDLFIYNQLKDSDPNEYITKKIEDYLQEIDRNDKHSKNYYIGRDGVYVQYVNKNK